MEGHTHCLQQVTSLFSICVLDGLGQCCLTQQTVIINWLFGVSVYCIVVSGGCYIEYFLID